jgi:uncharacterized protein YlzI (FlbEa/FlbD family)
MTALLLSCADDPAAGQQLAVTLIELTGLDGEPVAVNPHSVVTLRSPRPNDHLLPPGAACAVQTSDGKHVSVRETCEQVRQRLDAAAD